MPEYVDIPIPNTWEQALHIMAYTPQGDPILGSSYEHWVDGNRVVRVKRLSKTQTVVVIGLRDGYEHPVKIVLVQKVPPLPGQHKGEENPWDCETITDHVYFGNLCSGFGGTTECQTFLPSGGRCGKSPSVHVRTLPTHRGEYQGG